MIFAASILAEIVLGQELGSAHYNTYCLQPWNFEERWRDDSTGGWPRFNEQPTYQPGFRLHGGTGVWGKQTWNMIDGGYIQFSMDTSYASNGVNNNLYLTTPNSYQFENQIYCDVQRDGYDNNENCLELDLVEHNGNCRSHLGVHTWPDHDGGCDRGGCFGQANISGKRTFRMTFNSEGGFSLKYQKDDHKTWHTLHLTDHISGGGRDWTDAKARIKQQMENNGFLIHSSQWEGWVPTDNAADPAFDSTHCTKNEGLSNSYFDIWNVVVHGAIVQNIEGSNPPHCTQTVIDILNSDETQLNLQKVYTSTPPELGSPVGDTPSDELPAPSQSVEESDSSDDSSDSSDDSKDGKKHKGGKGKPKKHGKGPKKPKDQDDDEETTDDDSVALTTVTNTLADLDMDALEFLTAALKAEEENTDLAGCGQVNDFCLMGGCCGGNHCENFHCVGNGRL